MTAFDSLEKRVLNLTLAGTADSSESGAVVGLMTSAPPEDHTGAYGIAGEPAKAAAGSTGYRRAAAQFATQATNPTPAGPGVVATSNTNAVTITGLAPGTYTHFGVFGSTTAGQA